MTYPGQDQRPREPAARNNAREAASRNFSIAFAIPLDGSFTSLLQAIDDADQKEAATHG